MTPERVILLNQNPDNYPEQIKQGLSILEKYQTKDLLIKAQQELWFCGEIFTIVDSESQTIAYQLQTQRTQDTTNRWGCATKEVTEWIKIYSDGNTLMVVSNQSPNILFDLNQEEIKLEEAQKRIYEAITTDSDQRSFGKNITEKLSKVTNPFITPTMGLYRPRPSLDEADELDIPNRQ